MSTYIRTEENEYNRRDWTLRTHHQADTDGVVHVVYVWWAWAWDEEDHSLTWTDLNYVCWGLKDTVPSNIERRAYAFGESDLPLTCLVCLANLPEVEDEPTDL